MTPYQIAARADHLKGLANTVAINLMFRAQDESHLWPIRGRFNVTERAIRQTRAHMRECGETCEGLAYALSLDAAILQIVNNEVQE